MDKLRQGSKVRHALLHHAGLSVAGMERHAAVHLQASKAQCERLNLEHSNTKKRYCRHANKSSSAGKPHHSDDKGLSTDDDHGGNAENSPVPRVACRPVLLEHLRVKRDIHLME
jgi:hypothetical protein